jgi:hypothetical protein
MTPVTPQHLEPALEAFMLEPIEQRLNQVKSVVLRVAQADFRDAQEAHDVMILTCWQLEWIGYAREITEDQPMIEMVDLYKFMSRWRLRWQKLEEDPALMLQVRNEAREWSEKVLGWAGIRGKF